MKIECATTSPPGEPRWSARSAPAPGSRRPADEARDDGDPDDLGERDEQDLRARRARPHEPAAHVAVIAPQARRREHGEAEQEHGRVAAEDQQSFCGDAARRADRRDRAGRRDDGEDVGALLELRLRAVEPRAEARELPVVDRARRDRHDPAVRARDRARRRAAACGRTARRRRRARIGGRLPPPAPKYAASGAPALNVARPTTWRNGSFGATGAPPIWISSQSDGRAAARQAAAAKVEPAREAVDGAEIHERTAPRRLAEDEHAERLLAEDRLDRARARCGRAARSVRFDCAGHAAPHRLDRTVGRLRAARARAARRGPAPPRSPPRSSRAPPRRRRCRARRSASAASSRAGAGARSAPATPAARAPRARGGPRGRLRLQSPLGLILAGGSTGDNDLPVAPSGGLGSLLAVLTTNQKGVVAEAAVALEATRLGIGVYRPLTTSGTTSSSTFGRSCSACSASGRHATTT